MYGVTETGRSLEGVGKLHFLWMIKDGACHLVFVKTFKFVCHELVKYFLVYRPVVTYCGTGTVVKLFPSI